MKSKRFRAFIVSVGVLALLIGFLLLSHDRPERSVDLAEQKSSPDRVEEMEKNQAASAFEAFDRWLSDYNNSDENSRLRLITDGKAAAMRRAEQMKGLIRIDPEAALARAISLEDREGLPSEILPFLEKPFSTRAVMDVFPLCSDSEGHLGDAGFGKREIGPGARRQEFEIELTTSRGESLKAFVFGKRLGSLSRSAAPVQGVSLDGVAALREEIFTYVKSDELEELRKRYTLGPMGANLDFLTAEPVGENGVAAIAGGQLHFFANIGNLGRTENLATRLNENIGEENGAQFLFTQRLTLGHEPLDPNEVLDAAEELAAIPSNTTRSAICIRVDFPDKTGDPIAENTLQARMDGEVHDQVASMSYHKTGISTPVITQTLRMPQPSTYYNGTDDGQKKNSALFNDAMAAAADAGISTNGYDHRCVFFQGIGMGYCGLATVGGSKIWLPCHGSKVIVHELGHNFGLGHASFWTSTNDDPVDPNGTSSEYGDNTSIMGGGGVSAGHFHVQGKRKLDWLETDQVHYVGSGSAAERSLRIHRFDHEDTSTGNWKRAIRVLKGSGEYYWIGYRQRYGNNYPNYQKGIQLHWQQPSKSKSWLIDLTPGGGKNNSGLPLGRTYSDPVADIHVTALKRGGTNPDEWFDVQVNSGPFPGNSSPVGSINIPARVPVNESIELGASASDANGDYLAYFFDVGDGSVLGDDGTQSWRNHSWTSTGSKAVTLTVSDMKGGVFQQTAQVQVQTQIPEPTGVTASDGIFSDKVQVSWNTSASATGHVIYRGSEDFARASTPVATVGNVTTWDDESAAPGDIYFYRVQALGSNSASVLSGSDAGNRGEGPPAQPTIYSISDNLYTDRIQLAWSAVDFASGYEIFRGTSDEIGEATSLGVVTGATTFSDTTAEAGIRYYYWIHSQNNIGNSIPATGSGSRKLSAPTHFSASDGTATEEVILAWEPVPNATSYQIFRSSVSDSIGVQIAESQTVGYSDTPSTILTTYWYSIRAFSDGSGEGELSSKDSGFRVFKSPSSIKTLVRAFDDRVSISWNAVSAGGSGSIEYIVFRAPAGSSFEEAVEITRTSDLNFDDFSADPGVEYSYWVVGNLEGQSIASPAGDPVSGIRSEVPPYQPDLMLGPSPATGLGNNVINASGAGQFFPQKSKKGKTLNWYIKVENDGLFEDRLRMVGSGGDKFFQVSLFEAFGAHRNVTAASITGSYLVNSVQPDSSRLFLFSVKPTKKARKKGRRAYFDVRSYSSKDVGHMDRVLMQALAKKDKKRRR